MHPSTILFDLDGTLLDSRVGLGNAAAWSLQKVALGHLATRELLDRFLGVPLRQGYLEFCGMSEAECSAAVPAFEEYYLSKGIYECRLFPGIAELLSDLRCAGKTLMVATNGVGANARHILRHLGVEQHFAQICGLSSLGAVETKSDVIAGALRSIGADPDQSVMVGDRYYDMEAARNCRILSIGVLYGYGGAAELNAAVPTLMASTVEDLRSILLNEGKGAFSP